MPLGWAGLGWAVLRQEKLLEYLLSESGKVQQANHTKDWKDSKNYRSSGEVLIVLQYQLKIELIAFLCARNYPNSFMYFMWLIFCFTNKKLWQQEVKNLTHVCRGHRLQRDNLEVAVWLVLGTLAGQAAIPGVRIIFLKPTCAFCTREQALLHKGTVATDNSQSMDVWETIIPGCIGLLFIWSYLT